MLPPLRMDLPRSRESLQLHLVYPRCNLTDVPRLESVWTGGLTTDRDNQLTVTSGPSAFPSIYQRRSCFNDTVAGAQSSLIPIRLREIHPLQLPRL